MNVRKMTQWTAAGTLGLFLVGAAGAGMAAADGGDEEGIDLSVEIEDLTPPGGLAMTVAANDGVVLTEDGSDETARQFVGVTPTVTVTDSRTAEQIPEGAFWAVVGQAGDFVHAEDASRSFGAEYLGWAPHLLSGSSTGSVAEGEPVSSVIDDGSGADAVGLVGQELLLSTWSAADETGSWDVNADLTLRTPVDVPAGTYSATLTLSLFEG
ncbi:hypothetical protein [Isoptericola croceus]|uniref:hypothetical protein n=1 Tax=Isoptericola croceus TaxID=3031406 RepID=UPI0023F92134|nr:hypothetical protein [Isoptericola croceus]